MKKTLYSSAFALTLLLSSCSLIQHTSQGGNDCLQKEATAEAAPAVAEEPVAPNDQLLNVEELVSVFTDAAHMDAAMKKYGYKVHYAIKANYDDHLLAVIREYGLGIDCASGNELRKAVEAGFDPKGIVYAGVGKRDKELKYAIEQNILAINCESIEELELVDALAGEAGRVADVALRINPDIDPKTNHCIDTGQADSKFGISYEEVLEHAAEIRSLKNVNIIGLHLHIGSQIRELHVFENMCNKVNVIVENLEKLGCKFRFVDVGGGLGVNYDVPENEPIPNFASLFSIVHNHLRIGDREVHFEFGRSIVAECGELITTVLFNKTTATGRKLVIVDASMTELVRPAMYGSYHNIENITSEEIITDILNNVIVP